MGFGFGRFTSSPENLTQQPLITPKAETEIVPTKPEIQKDFPLANAELYYKEEPNTGKKYLTVSGHEQYQVAMVEVLDNGVYREIYPKYGDNGITDYLVDGQYGATINGTLSLGGQDSTKSYVGILRIDSIRQN